MKQAVVIIHGMGEQIPMDTLTSFVDAVWVMDETLINRNRPDSNTGEIPRKRNPIWAKPDQRTRSFELRRLTTEQSDSGRQTDFFEFYWAHLMHGTTWEHVQAWIVDLLWRNPIHRVPKNVRFAWGLLWVIALGVLWFGFTSLVPAKEEARHWIWSLASGVGAVAVGWFVSNVLVARFGDVARYVKAKPPNVARRQEIREKGVELLETLINSKEDDGTQTYDRVTVVAHSLGTIVAYDILAHCFARMNTRLKLGSAEEMAQPARAALERAIWRALDMPSDETERADEANGVAETRDDRPFDVVFQELQAAARAELNAQGNPWIVSDFVTLGSPLTHAEFLLAHDMQDLQEMQGRRVLPTCPPTLEYDGTSKLRHIGYRTRALKKIGTGKVAEDPRIPHHAALFAYTRWTNLYSKHKLIIKGDIISGPLGEQFGLKIGNRNVTGIRDIAVLPARGSDGRPKNGFSVPFLTHNKYWNMRARSGSSDNHMVPDHIETLRSALRLNDA